MNGGATSAKIAALPSATAREMSLAEERPDDRGDGRLPSIDSRASALAHCPNVSQFAWSWPRIAATASDRA